MFTTFLITVGVMCAITTLLALVMVICEATIGNYGRVRITVNGRRELDVEGGKPLLSTLKEEGIFIPSACGGRGSCGLCKVTLAEPAGTPAPTEMPWLQPAERSGNVRLSCQLKVKKPLAITIPAELLNVRQFRTRVSSLRDLTHDIKEVRLKLLDPPRMEFVAGQFIQFEVPPYELTEQPVYRAYSISSPPSDPGELELEIRYVPNGICTTYVHRRLKAGDEVVVNGPYGDFRLSGSGREAIFIAGGSGMAPIKSMLLDMANRGDTRRVRYFFGARSKRDLFLVDTMRQLEASLPDFRFIPALSSPDSGDGWTGETGVITDVVARQFDAGDGAEAYLCGSPLMIDACIKVLAARGIPNDRIFFDKFS